MGLERTDFYDFVKSLNPVLFRALLLGNYNALDEYNRATTVNGSPDGFVKDRKGYGVDFGPNGRLVVSHGAEQNPASGITLVAFGSGFNSAGRLISKRDASTTSYDFYIGGVDQVGVYDGVLGVLANGVPTVGVKSLAAKYEFGSTAHLYSDGVFILSSVTTFATPTSTADVQLGNLYTGTTPLDRPLQCALVLPYSLSDEQISDLHRLWLEIPSVELVAPCRSYFFVKNPPAGISGHTETFSMKVEASGKIIGVKGASEGTLANQVTGAYPKIVLDGALRSHYAGESQLAFDNPTNLITATQGAIELVVTPNEDTPAGTREVASSDGNTNIVIQQLSTGAWRGGAGNPQQNIDSAAASAHKGQPAHLLLTWWGGENLEFFVDGVSQGTTTFSGGAVVSYLNAMGRLAVNAINADYHLVRTYNERVSVADARRLYLQYAIASIELAPREAYPVTLANKTGGRVGPWLIGSGTWAYRDDGSRRLLSCVASGWCSVTSDMMYGAWYWRAKYDGSNANYLALMPKRKGYTTAGQNGYIFTLRGFNDSVVVYRVTNGTAVLASAYSGAGAVSEDTDYELFFTRRSDGLFSMYIRGGDYSTWTLLDTGTDNTHKASQVVMADVDNGDYQGDHMFFPLGGTLLPTDVPGLED